MGKLLMGPGPSNVNPRVLEAMSKPLVGHLDPDFLKIMDSTMELLRQIFKTKNRLTFPVSGTGSAGMESIIVNLIEPEDKVIVGLNGVFGTRVADLLGRIGAEVIGIKKKWGEPILPDEISDAFDSAGDKVKALVLVHAETSTGVLQPLEEAGRIARENDALFIVDTVTSLGGVDVRIDEWLIDASYSGTQKNLSVPPGLSPVTVNERALEVLRNRKTKVPSWYFDFTMIEKYWGSERVYHHTAPVSMICGLNEGLKIILEEGLENRFKRHRQNHEFLKNELSKLGIDYLVKPEYRLPNLNAVLVPEGIDEKEVRMKLLKEYSIEIGAGLGELAGKVWRIGLMGETCRKENVEKLIAALKKLL
ncbi:MAG: alanine--glyoxylate aminotransferase family protein [Candidatus Schekmanbacteria bacterium]|nr:MAG: alanine--glyoxylate aminotransferase family protein [Candidatus Schekmanbacteria bacterium]